MDINKELNDLFQEYLIPRQLTESGESEEDSINRSEGVKRAIQKMFIKYVILGFDSIKPMLEDLEGADKLYEAMSNRESKEVADEIFYSAIKEVQDFVAGEYGLAPRRKKEYEKLAEQLEEKYGEGAIGNNINRVILKNKGSNPGDSCGGGGCGC
jgi:hypothetical protein